MNRKRLAALGLAVTLSMTAAACGKSTEEVQEASAVAVEVLTPTSGELTVDTTYIGNVTPSLRLMMKRRSFSWPVQELPTSQPRPV